MILNTLEFIHPSPLSRREEKLSMLHLNVALSDAGEQGVSHTHYIGGQVRYSPETDCETVNGRTAWKV